MIRKKRMEIYQLEYFAEACRQRIAALALRELELLCARHPWWVRPRWELQPEVWRALLRAAGGRDDAALHGTLCRGVQLMAASLLQTEPPRRTPRTHL